VEEPPCKLDINALEGDFAVRRNHPEFGAFVDKDFRVHFRVEGDKKMAYATRGLFNPGNMIDPTTNKNPYELKSVSDRGEALYVQDMLALNKVPPEKVEELKNQDFLKNGFVFEMRLYVKADMDKCRLTISDMHHTWNKGQEVEDSNPGGTQKYVAWEGKELSRYNCAVLGDLALVAAKDGEELAQVPVPHIGSSDKLDFRFEADADEDSGGKEGCTYRGVVYLRDEKTDIAVNVASEKKKNVWSFSTMVPYVEKEVWAGRHRNTALVELQRWRTCGGKEEYVSGHCSALIPDPPTTPGADEGSTE
jgi:hypothetical protein